MIGHSLLGTCAVFFFSCGLLVSESYDKAAADIKVMNPVLIITSSSRPHKNQEGH